MEKLKEFKTSILFRFGILHVFETNSSFNDLGFLLNPHTFFMVCRRGETYFEDKIEPRQFSDFIMIPNNEKGQSIDIHDLSLAKPLIWYLLDLTPDFLEKFYYNLARKNQEYKYNIDGIYGHFITRAPLTLDAFKRLCKSITSLNSELDNDVNEYILKELLTRLFQTEAKQLLIQSMLSSLSDKAIEKVVLYIKSNFINKITIADLMKVSNLGKTNLFNRFSSALKMTPVNFIVKERIEHSKRIMKDSESLESVAYESGFNTYGHFYTAFIRLEKITPKSYKKSLLENN